MDEAPYLKDINMWLYGGFTQLKPLQNMFKLVDHRREMQ